jgi:transmembrane sensor
MSEHQHQRAAEQQRAWDLLGTVASDPTVQGWLHDIDRIGPQRRRFGWRSAITLAASVLLACGAGMAAYIHFDPPHYETHVGEQRDVLLADGSRVTLNTDTALTVRFSKSRRYIELQHGEALFSVNHDPQRPFDVSAGATLTRALGTQFDVDMRDSNITVSVLAGAVKVVTANTGKATIVPALANGDAVEVLPTEHRVVARKADLRRIDAWRTRRLDFSDTPLPAAVAEFNRYSNVHIVIGTRELESVRVSGVFSIGDVEGFLFSLREALGVRTLDSPGEVTLIRSK